MCVIDSDDIRYRRGEELESSPLDEQCFVGRIVHEAVDGLKDLFEGDLKLLLPPAVVHAATVASNTLQRVFLTRKPLADRESTHTILSVTRGQDYKEKHKLDSKEI